MLRINLLPAYIAERKKTQNAIIANIALFAVVLGGALYYNFGMLQPAVKEAEDRATARQAEADAVTAYASATAQLRTKVAPLQAKVAFVKNVRFHNTVRQRIFRKAAQYTYREVEYDSMAVTGNTLAIKGYVRKLSDIGRTYMTFYGNPDVTAVSISGMPGWPTAEQQQNERGADPTRPLVRPAYPIELTATLVRPVVTPTMPDFLNGSGAVPGGGGGPSAAPPPPSAPPPTDGNAAGPPSDR